MSRVPQSVRDEVRNRAGQRCEYCRKPEGVSRFPHHVDHIIPIAHGGTGEAENLAWACFQCNTNKIRDIASFDPETKALTLLYNPRQQLWDDHFELNGALIVGKSPEGRATVQLLQMNITEQIETRQELFRTGRW